MAPRLSAWTGAARCDERPTGGPQKFTVLHEQVVGDVADDEPQRSVSGLQLVGRQGQAQRRRLTPMVPTEAGGPPGARVAAVTTAAGHGAVHEEVVRSVRPSFEALVADGGARTHAAGSAAVGDVALAPDTAAHVGACPVSFLDTTHVFVAGLRTYHTDLSVSGLKERSERPIGTSNGISIVDATR